MWLLGISLVIPTSLPAGGAQKSIIETRENQISSPFIALKEFNLLSSASNSSSILSRFRAGTPVNVIKAWDSIDGEKWLLVNVLTQEFYQLFYRRGWVNISST